MGGRAAKVAMGHRQSESKHRRSIIFGPCMHPGKNTLLNGTLYVLALVGTCVAQLKDLHALEYACRPLLMLILLTCAISMTSPKSP